MIVNNFRPFVKQFYIISDADTVYRLHVLPNKDSTGYDVFINGAAVSSNKKQDEAIDIPFVDFEKDVYFIFTFSEPMSKVELPVFSPLSEPALLSFVSKDKRTFKFYYQSNVLIDNFYKQGKQILFSLKGYDLAGDSLIWDNLPGKRMAENKIYPTLKKEYFAFTFGGINLTIAFDASSYMRNGEQGGYPLDRTDEILNHLLYDHVMFDGASQCVVCYLTSIVKSSKLANIIQ